MLMIGIIFFIMTAIFGTIILSAILKNMPTPKPVVFLHGAGALIAILVMASFLAAGHFNTLFVISFVLFILAALGGLTLFTIDMQGKPIPKAIALIHPLVALSALLLLIIYFLQ